jgi:hypothetical protein
LTSKAYSCFWLSALYPIVTGEAKKNQPNVNRPLSRSSKCSKTSASTSKRNWALEICSSHGTTPSWRVWTGRAH